MKKLHLARWIVFIRIISTINRARFDVAALCCFVIYIFICVILTIILRFANASAVSLAGILVSFMQRIGKPSTRASLREPRYWAGNLFYI